MPAPVVQSATSTVGSASFAGFNHVPTTSPAPDRIFIRALASRGTGSAQSAFGTVTYSGAAFVPIATVTTPGASRRVAYYFLPNAIIPSGTGPYFVNVSTTSATGVTAVLLEITGAVQAPPSNTAQNTATTTITSIAASINTVGTDSLVLDCTAGSYTGDSAPGPGQTEYDDNTVSSLTSAVSGKVVASPQTTSMLQTFSTTTARASILLLEVRASAPSVPQSNVTALAGFSF